MIWLRPSPTRNESPATMAACRTCVAVAPAPPLHHHQRYHDRNAETRNPDHGHVQHMARSGGAIDPLRNRLVHQIPRSFMEHISRLLVRACCGEPMNERRIRPDFRGQPASQGRACWGRLRPQLHRHPAWPCPAMRRAAGGRSIWRG